MAKKRGWDEWHELKPQLASGQAVRFGWSKAMTSGHDGGCNSTHLGQKRYYQSSPPADQGQSRRVPAATPRATPGRRNGAWPTPTNTHARRHHVLVSQAN